MVDVDSLYRMQGRRRPAPVRAVVCFLAFCAVAAAQTQDRDLKGLSLEQLGNLEVTTVSKEPVTIARTAAAIYVITQEDIRRSGVTSIPEALRLAPGVDVERIDGVKWAIGIRGFTSRLSRSVLVLIDGRSVYSPLFHGVYWEVQDTLLEDVDRIEVIRGPGGSIWGANAVDGVINIITKKSKDTRGGLVSASGGTVDQASLDARYGAGNGKDFNYRVYGKGFDRGPEYHFDNRNFDDWRRFQAGFRADWDASSRDAVTVQGDFYDGVAGESVRIASLTPPSSSVVDSNAYLAGGNILGRWQRTFSGTSDLQIQAYFDRVNRRQASQAEYRNTFDLDLVHRFALATHNEFTWGFGVRVSRGWVPAVVSTYVFTPDKRTDHLYTAFIQDEVSLIPDRLSFTAGAKIIHSAFTGFDAEPSVRLLWTPTAKQTFWAPSPAPCALLQTSKTISPIPPSPPAAPSPSIAPAEMGLLHPKPSSVMKRATASCFTPVSPSILRHFSITTITSSALSPVLRSRKRRMAIPTPCIPSSTATASPAIPRALS